MRAYILTESDFEKLLAKIDRDPKHGRNGGSSNAEVRHPEHDRAYDEAHRFYNYQVRSWVDDVQR